MKYHQLLLPRNLTWNLKFTHWKRKNIFQILIVGFHVNFRGCNPPILSKVPGQGANTPLIQPHRGTREILTSPMPTTKFSKETFREGFKPQTHFPLFNCNLVVYFSVREISHNHANLGGTRPGDPISGTMHGAIPRVIQSSTDGVWYPQIPV